MPDLSSAEYAVLCRLRDKGQLSQDDRVLVSALRRKHFVADNANFEPCIRPLGLAAMLQYEEMLQKERDAAAEQAEKNRAHHAQMVEDRKLRLRHDLFVAAFSVALALVLEHCGDIVHFIQHALNVFLSH